MKPHQGEKETENREVGLKNRAIERGRSQEGEKGVEVDPGGTDQGQGVPDIGHIRRRSLGDMRIAIKETNIGLIAQFVHAIVIS